MAPEATPVAPLPATLPAFLEGAGYGTVLEATTLHGGMISLTRRIRTRRGTLVLKQAQGAPPDLYRREADGLRMLADAGTRVPAVVDASDDYLLLEDLGSRRRDGLDWEELGRALARQHARHGESFGLDEDNYLGLLRQRNERMADGHEFFARHRILRFLEEPRAAAAFDARDRRRIERLACRLPQLVPAQPASLVHGDLWRENILASADGLGVLVDPAVHYGWAEAELAMVHQCGGVPERFFAAYAEASPLADGWRERLGLLSIREWLSALAHLGPEHPDGAGPARGVRELLDRFA